MGFSWKFSLKPIHWENHGNISKWFWVKDSVSGSSGSFWWSKWSNHMICVFWCFDSTWISGVFVGLINPLRQESDCRGWGWGEPQQGTKIAGFLHRGAWSLRSPKDWMNHWMWSLNFRKMMMIDWIFMCFCCHENIYKNNGKTMVKTPSTNRKMMSFTIGF